MSEDLVLGCVEQQVTRVDVANAVGWQGGRAVTGHPKVKGSDHHNNYVLAEVPLSKTVNSILVLKNAVSATLYV